MKPHPLLNNKEQAETIIANTTDLINQFYTNLDKEMDWQAKLMLTNTFSQILWASVLLPPNNK